MEENKDYRVHRSGDLSEGYKLQVEHTVSCENTDISALIVRWYNKVVTPNRK